MRKLILTVLGVIWVIVCLLPWVAMEPSLWRVPAAIGLTPFAVPALLFIWCLGDWPHTVRLMRALLPSPIVNAWDRT
ncbi:MAG: hypothetical protein AWU57_295 [Marinobacter sp. T13-3]|nr:MAG: hypothetical protein AWU57_295 [Marinobacter sp. T13-3]